MTDIDCLFDRIDIAMRKKSSPWTDEEDEYLRRSLGFIPEEEIAAELGRTVTAVHLRWKRDLNLPAPSKDPNYLSATRAAELLGIDAHKVTWWVDSGIIQGEMLPGKRRIRRIEKRILIEWLLDPDNWVYFSSSTVTDPNLRQMIEKEQTDWGDKWWNTRQVAEHLGIDIKDVTRYIRLGRLEGRQVPCLGGRHTNPYWARWFILRSEATRPDLVVHEPRKKRQK